MIRNEPLPTVSVCVATYNQAQYIERCIQSIFTQDAVINGLLNVEVIVGDDCSNDATSSVLDELKRRYGASLVVVRNELNIGPARNYLSILSKAAGDYIAHLDGDDYWESKKLGVQIDFLDQHLDSEAVCSNARVVDKHEMDSGIFTNIKSRMVDLEYLAESGNFLNHSSLLYRRAALSTILKLSPPFIDYAILLALARRAPIGFIEEPLVCYRAGLPGSIQRLQGGQVRDLYREALIAALPYIESRAARRSAANYIAYAIMFAVSGKGERLDALTFAQLAVLARTSYLLLAVSTAIRVGVLAAKASYAWGSQRFFGEPHVHHPRY